jgi:cytochrome bd-type quinol oxidase subunit 1
MLNPTWAPLTLHRFLGVMIISFYAIGLYGGLQLLWRKPKMGMEEEAYYMRVMRLGMVMGTGLLLFQPIAGMFYSIQIRRANPEAYERILFELEWLVRLQFLLIGLLFYLSNQFFAQISSNPRLSRILNGVLLLAAFLTVLAAQQVWIRRGLTFVLILITLYRLSLILAQGPPLSPHRRGPWLAISVGFCAVATFLVMGVIREQARRPYTVYGEVHLEDEKQPESELVQR